MNRRLTLIALWGGLFATVAGVVVWAHWPALSAQAISFDDDQYLTRNPLVQNPGWASARRFFAEILTPSTVEGYYQPLSMISLMLDDALGGRPDNLRPFHRTSLALHAINTLLIIVLLYLLFGRPWIAAMVGLLFGVHPLTVESVAWIADRKTVLTSFFALLALIAYVRYVHINLQSEIGNRKWRTVTSYCVCIGCYLLALLSKPTSTPLPVCMLLLDYWPLRRLNRRTIIEKVPFFLIGLVSAIITFISQKNTSIVYDPGEHSRLRIPLILGHNIVFYLYKMFFPIRLSSHYPFPEPFSPTQPMVLAGIIGSVVLIAALLISWRWTRACLIGWLFFFVAILPTMGGIGFTNVIAADRYAYLPSFGVLMVLAWILDRSWSGGAPNKTRTNQVIICAVVLILSVSEVRATRQYLGVWQNTEKLYRHMLSLTPRVGLLYNNLGNAFFDRGKTDEAIANYRQALQLQPDLVQAYNNLGFSLARQGKNEDAIVYYRQALQLNPDLADVHNNLGFALARRGDTEGAIVEYNRAVQLKPNNVEAHYNLAQAYVAQGKTEQAIAQYRQVVQLKPDHAPAHYNLGNALAQQGRTGEAIVHYRQVLRLTPDDTDAHNNLGIALIRQGQTEEAIVHYSRALQLKPDQARVHNNLGIALIRQGRTEEAMAHFRQAIQLKPDYVEAHNNLGMLLQEQGQRDKAIAEYHEVLRIDPKNEKAQRQLQSLSTQQTNTSAPAK